MLLDGVNGKDKRSTVTTTHQRNQRPGRKAGSMVLPLSYANSFAFHKLERLHCTSHNYIDNIDLHRQSAVLLFSCGAPVYSVVYHFLLPFVFEMATS